MVSVTPALAWALVCGVGLGLGLWAMFGAIPRFGRPRLVSRVAPYVTDVSVEAREFVARRPSDPLPVFGFLLGPLIASGTAALSAVLGSSEQTAHRLRQAGLEIGVPEFRSQQLAWGAIGSGAGLVLSLVIARSSEVPVLMAVVIVAVGAASGVVLRDYVLQRVARARLSRMADELPTVLEFLTLSLSSGEGILDALTRVARISSGELSGELAGVILGVRTGLPLGESLTRLADDLQLPALSRCIEQLTGALDRGTPLAEVLRAQAQDSREESKRELLELAGKKEVAMLVPLVFLILPLTIFFAIFPGIVVLQMGF